MHNNDNMLNCRKIKHLPYNKRERKMFIINSLCFLYEFEATLDESHCPAFGTFKLQLVIKFRNTMSVLHLSTTLRTEYIYIYILVIIYLVNPKNSELLQV